MIQTLWRSCFVPEVCLLTPATMKAASVTVEAMPAAMKAVSAVEEWNEDVYLRAFKSVWVRTIVGIIIPAVINRDSNTACQHQ